VGAPTLEPGSGLWRKRMPAEGQPHPRASRNSTSCNTWLGSHTPDPNSSPKEGHTTGFDQLSALRNKSRAFNSPFRLRLANQRLPI
jgi:hypothetical protein